MDQVVVYLLERGGEVRQEARELVAESRRLRARAQALRADFREHVLECHALFDANRNTR